MKAASPGSAKIALLTLVAVFAASTSDSAAADAPDLTDVPRYEVDAFWPRLPLPHNWALGQLAGVAVDADENIWILQRPGTLYPWEKAAAANPPIANCCVPAPPVIQFDPSGKVLRAWGGPGEGYDWPATEHGLYIDHEGNIWIGGSRTARPGGDNGAVDGMVLKFTPDGELLLQIGGAGPSEGSLDKTQLAGAADVAVYPPTNEVFIADGYGNNRVIVFDADTGEFKRMWGAYGKPPTDEELAPYDPAAPPPKQFRTVHCIAVSADGIVYVCDRDNNRVQAFDVDGTFVAEWFYRKDTLTGRGRGPGTVLDIAFSPDSEQRTMLIADAPNSEVLFVRRADGQVIGSFGHFGNYAGQLNRLHQLAVDSKGNIYTAEATGKRIQKFVRLEGTDVTLSGDHEVPSVKSSATGSGSIVVGSDRVMSGSITTSGVEGIAAHIHLAPPGKNGPPVVALINTSENVWAVPAGTVLTEEQYRRYLSGDLYVNVHSAAHKSGEIRDQIDTE